jgi:hypothetical protein
VGFTPGDGLLLVGSTSALLLGPSASDELVVRLRELVRRDPPVDVLLDALTAGGLRSLPSFACVVSEPGAVRVVVRGELGARLDAPGGPRVIEGRAVSTWVEQLVPGVERWALGPAGTVAAEGGRWWVVDGAVPAAAAWRLVAAEPVAAEPVGVEPVGVEPVAAEPPAPAPGDVTLPGLVDEEDLTTTATVPPRALDPPVDAPVAAAAEEAGVTDEARTTPAASVQRGHRPGAPRPATPPTMVQGVRCAAGHPNPPGTPACRTCAAALGPAEVELVPRPPLGRLAFDDGTAVELDGPVLIGRQPGPAAPLGGQVPLLVAVPDPDKALSRTHVELQLEGWEVVLIDRNSLNHTFLELPPEPPVQLRPGERRAIPPGARVHLADVSSFTYEPTG